MFSGSSSTLKLFCKMTLTKRGELHDQEQKWRCSAHGWREHVATEFLLGDEDGAGLCQVHSWASGFTSA
jgi:hypothetical protein